MKLASTNPPSQSYASNKNKTIKKPLNKKGKNKKNNTEIRKYNPLTDSNSADKSIIVNINQTVNVKIHIQMQEN